MREGTHTQTHIQIRAKKGDKMRDSFQFWESYKKCYCQFYDNTFENLEKICNSREKYKIITGIEGK